MPNKKEVYCTDNREGLLPRRQGRDVPGPLPARFVERLAAPAAGDGVLDARHSQLLRHINEV